MAATVGDQRQQYVCPFPRSWYPADSPCAHSDEFHVGGNDPAITDADITELVGLSREEKIFAAMDAAASWQETSKYWNVVRCRVLDVISKTNEITLKLPIETLSTPW